MLSAFTKLFFPIVLEQTGGHFGTGTNRKMSNSLLGSFSCSPSAPVGM